MKKWLFTKEEVMPFFQGYSRILNGGVSPPLDTEIAQTVKASRTVISHGTDSRVLEFIIYVRGQMFDKRYFKYAVQHDPVPRYTGTDKTNWAINFWMSKTHGLYHEREAIIERVRATLVPLALPGYSYEENVQAIAYIYRFPARTLPTLKAELDQHLYPLINAVQPMFADVVRAFSKELSSAERREVIARREVPAGLNRLSPAFGSDPRYNRSVPARLRQAVFKRDNFICRLCGFSGPADALHADHKTPVAHGGLTVLENLQTLCVSCNLKKGGRRDWMPHGSSEA